MIVKLNKQVIIWLKPLESVLKLGKRNNTKVKLMVLLKGKSPFEDMKEQGYLGSNKLLEFSKIIFLK